MRNTGIVFGIFIAFLALHLPSYSYGGEIEVQRDKEKTVYSIGSSQENKNGTTEAEKDKEKAWDMLRNSNIIIDKRKNKSN
ncbi:MAG: hypothetical protein A4E64_01280 [Syntrophorhabdus sp. PtaU1.Bin058]|nr:MAG: hypothetical protein A4E64_01280 [Syntrophorhabdus sp. PtaU1.Bin058]